MSLDLNQVRAEFAAFLASHASRRHSLDAALMHVVEAAYQKGLNDALLVPAVLQGTRPNLDGSLAHGNGSALAAAPTAGHPAGIHGQAGGTSPAGSTEDGNAPSAPAALTPPAQDKPKGGALAKLAGMWCNEAGFHTWLSDKWPDAWERHDPHTGDVPNNEVAGKVLRELLTVKTRAELDHNPDASARFKRLILQPYADHLKGAQA